MYKKFLLGALIVILLIITAACGSKDVRSIIDELTDLNKDMYSYSATGKMTLYTGQAPTKYNVEVWYKKPNCYRVSLNNTTKDITQVLLKNEQGSYVLTPQLSKSFRFQSQWPNNPAQIYLYQANISNILKDDSRKFINTKAGYQFEIKSHTQHNPNWNQTRVLLDKDLYPKQVDVLDKAQKIVASMQFEEFNSNVSFDNDAFTVERNMTLGKFLPESSTTLSQNIDFEVMDPTYIPSGVKVLSVQKVDSLYGPATVMTFGGKYNFTLMQSYPRKSEIAATRGDIVAHDMAAVGVFIEQKDYDSLNWLYNGMEFSIKGKMPMSEMLKIANSVR